MIREPEAVPRLELVNLIVGPLFALFVEVGNIDHTELSVSPKGRLFPSPSSFSNRPGESVSDMSNSLAAHSQLVPITIAEIPCFG